MGRRLVYDDVNSNSFLQGEKNPRSGTRWVKHELLFSPSQQPGCSTNREVVLVLRPTPDKSLSLKKLQF